MKGSRRLLSIILASGIVTLAARALAAGSHAVVINEIHYHPGEGSGFEFVEIHNFSAAPIDVGRWSFRKGLHAEIPPGRILPAGGFLVACASPADLALRYGLPEAALVPWVESRLANEGEEILLVDATGAAVDAVRYDDRTPWPTAPDGSGPSLQRLCPRADSNGPTNWVGASGQDPTPLAPNVILECPPPVYPPPRVALNEIHYHPFNDRDADEEYLEITNAAAETIDLQGYCFIDGIDFCFTGPTPLEPGAFIVVCRNQAFIRSTYGITNAAGDFLGELSNDGERVTLVDEKGVLADSVRYEDDGDWPIAADGLGYSLEKIVPAAVSDDPASWTDGGSLTPAGSDEWQTVTITGAATSSTLYFYSTEAAEYLIDDVSLSNEANPAVNLIGNGSFNSNIAGWQPRGNHSGSRWSQAPGGTIFPEAALHLIADGQGTGSSNSVAVTTSSTLDLSGVAYRLTFSYRRLSGQSDLLARLSQATPSRGLYWVSSGNPAGQLTPGAPNGALREQLPPFVSRVSRFPQEPTSADEVRISARVSGSPGEVRLTANLAGGAREFLMLDDGLSSDGAAGDGVFGAKLPAQPHNAVVTFRIQADSAAGGRLSPSPTDPMAYHGYYVNDAQPDSKLPVYTLIVPSSDPRGWIAALDCTNYRNFDFAYRGDLHYQVGIRRRGQSVCYDSAVIKKFLKVRFHRGHEFEGKRRLNFQSLWTDKSLVREHLAWETFQEMGSPYFEHRYVRLHANGRFFGLYASLEHSDARLLERNGLDPEGNLYKAEASREERTGVYSEETNQDGDLSDLTAFLNALHDTPASGLVNFFQNRVDADNLIEYQTAQVLINNSDYPHKNHYLFHDLARDRWMALAWDLDLTYGKLWDGNYGGVLNDKMHNPGISPWYTTSVRGEGTGNFLLDKFFAQSGTFYRRAYLVRLWDALQEKYRQDVYEAKITALSDLLYDDQAEDIAAWGRSPATANDPTAPAGFLSNLGRVRDHLRLRRAYLLGYLQNTEGFRGHDRLKITEIMYHPTSGEDAEYLELWNPSGKEITLTGWKIEGLEGVDGQGVLQEYRFPAGLKVATDEVFIVAKDPARFRAIYGEVARVLGPYAGNLDDGGETLRVRDAGPGYPATVDFVRYSTDDPWPWRPDGFGYSLELFDVTADRDNDLPGSWRASLLACGSPGGIHRPSSGSTVFRRGNCNGDGQVDVSDALAILLYLFAGNVQPACLDGCDVNGDLAVGVADAVALIQYLFATNGFPVPPPGPSQCQPAREGFCEVSNC